MNFRLEWVTTCCSHYLPYISQLRGQLPEFLLLLAVSFTAVCLRLAFIGMLARVTLFRFIVLYYGLDVSKTTQTIMCGTYEWQERNNTSSR